MESQQIDQIFNQLQETNFQDNTQISQKLIDRLKNALNDEEQIMFLDSFIGYLMYDQEKDFVVDLDEIYGWMYTRKDTAKEKLINSYEENSDYIKASGKSQAGQNTEKILMNIDTFKNMCLESQKGKKYRKYYIKMERCKQDQIKQDAEEERKFRLEAEKKEQILTKQLESKQSFIDDIAQIGIVYIGQSKNDISNLHKIGKTTVSNQQERLSAQSNTQRYEYLHTQKCIDPSLLEKTAHYILEKNGYWIDKETYKGNFEYKKAIVQILGCVFDVLLRSRDKASQIELIKKINQYLEQDKNIQSEQQNSNNSNSNAQHANNSNFDQNTINSTIRLFEQYFKTTENINDYVLKDQIRQFLQEKFNIQIPQNHKHQYVLQFKNWLENQNSLNEQKINGQRAFMNLKFKEQI